ncbi:uncharacterized protein FOMMEDRAFT_19579 [Fomitiporia mediterranea MF3/22]|uniref:uncharacterized protein n=1 Tax=Fomitiporia mediterranea (strain MF3/22) TaxID=694068 RepID=UPI0004407402|nr:uncharacterized protein FOMMEDRAFT_19579 [Fomitiporia mediterranea MF3/22]EJD04322.1 hypothetical protein FOMMEDRAFT_19579 [Fomitiporia mediterranea MF3/22]
MAKADKEAVLSDLTSRIFASMMGEIAMDVAIQAQKEERNSLSVCKICGMRCNQVHALPEAAPAAGSSRAGSPTIDGLPPPDSGTPGSSGKSDGNINLSCVNCQRLFASNRYAQHLTTCLGVGTGVRRTAQRNAVTKTKTNANTRSGSPYVDEVEDAKPIKGKGKAKGRAAAEDDVVGALKSGLPQPSPTKKQKKGRATPATGTGPPRLPGSRLGPPGSNPKPPSKVRSTPTPSIASHISKTSHSPSAHSNDSSDAEGGIPATGGTGVDSGAEGEGESQSSVLGGISPSLPTAESIGRGRSKAGSFSQGTGSGGGSSAGGGSKAKKVTGTGPPAKKPPPPPVNRLPSLPPPPPPPVRQPNSTFLIDIEGDETGSDTD